MKPSSNRLVPVDAFERRELEELGSKLVSFLDREALLLPSFSPYAFEFEIPAANAVEYAGYHVMGKIDRIDVDDRGRAVIIDYKSSLSSDYDLYEPQKKGGSFRKARSRRSCTPRLCVACSDSRSWARSMFVTGVRPRYWALWIAASNPRKSPVFARRRACTAEISATNFLRCLMRRKSASPHRSTG